MPKTRPPYPAEFRQQMSSSCEPVGRRPSSRGVRLLCADRHQLGRARERRCRQAAARQGRLEQR